MTSYAQIDSRTAYLSTDFGEEIARKWFGDESVDSLPRYTRGPRKGKIKGAVAWSKVVRGGWIRTGRETANSEASGYVERRVGRVFDRKLHEITSGRFGVELGRTIRDLEREENEKEYRRLMNVRIDKDMRNIEMERTRIEQVILSGKFDHNIYIFQKLVQDRNEDIKALCEQMKF
jgi:hypothetical protein